MNRAKEKLRAGGTVLVFNPNFPSPALVEHAGSLGFDVAFIDCEHGTADFERVEELGRAARAGGMTSILRPWSTDPGLVTRYLDCGVGGIQFPHVDDAAAARAAVETVRCARGARFEETLVAVMVESAHAVQRIESIAAVPGVDVVVIGLADLARSLGHPGTPDHPAVHGAVDRIIAACVGAGAVAGFNLHNWEGGPRLQAKGVRWFTLHARTMLARGSREVHALLGAA
ncbi:MAG: 2,4-dihydroxyhept-2-ene-1,7-dioic acid aldolase [Betaproteobacteria bacterium]|nr:MAG: 2,4-dihydroxyhept-2-ene-1,7-dioic acid aldolase [Betaproteobacteria bacterium]